MKYKIKEKRSTYEQLNQSTIMLIDLAMAEKERGSKNI